MKGVKSYLELFGTENHTDGSHCGVLLFFESKRYLFRCGENLTRIFTECKTRYNKIHQIFFTQINSETCLGLPGYLLTVSDSGMKQMELFGPSKDLFTYLKSLRFFMKQKEFITKVNSSDTFADENVTIHLLPLRNNDIQSFPLEDDFFVQKSWPLSTDEEPFVKKSKWDAEMICHRDRYHILKQNQLNSYQLVNYYIECKDELGKFDPIKAMELGVKKGPLFGQLSKGQTIQLEDGTIVKPEQVMSKTQPGAKILILEWNDVLVDMKSFLQLPQIDTIFENTNIIIHWSKYDIVSSEAYQTMLNRFQSSVHHIFLNDKQCKEEMIFEKANQLQSKLNILDSTIFPLFHTLNKSSHPTMQSVHGMKMVTSPFDSIGKIIPFVQQQKSATNEMDVIREHFAQHVQKQVSNERGNILFLGTGSACPSKYRNVTGVYYYSNDYYFVMDCGEGTLFQLYRMMGKEKADSLIRKLQVIWISHLHADHHLGLFTILQRRRELNNETPITIIGVPFIEVYLNEFAKAFHVSSLPCQFLNIRETPCYSISQNATLEFFKVEHSCEAYALVFCIVENDLVKFKLVNSGDTRGNHGLLKEKGKDCNVLIHEATFEDAMLHEAESKKHSTMGEAIETGVQMQSKFIILTHFSQRYPKIAPLKKQQQQNCKIWIAFDMSAISLSDSDHTANYYSELVEPIQTLFDKFVNNAEEE